MLPCSWKETFGFECLSCGTQRSFLLLIQGDLWGSLMMFPALLPMLFLVIFVPLHLKFKFKNGARIILVSFSLSALLMILNYGIKLSNGTVFMP
ncbi:MAG: DUF2752 domain-containing protein [Bacteroidetes bacterium]|nr:MAG: DUF2752 domain-containing protein [Bacteroidota bacterium]